MACYCNVLEVTNIDVTAGTAFELVYVPAQTLVDYRVYTLCIPQAFPAIEGIEPVTLNDGTTSYPLYDRFGNIVRAGQLTRTMCRKPYRIGFGSDGADGAHFVMLSDISRRLSYSPTPALVPSV